MNAIKKRLQMLKIEKDLAMDKADLCDQQAKEANRREEKLRDEVRELAKKLVQMERDLELSKAQLEKSNRDLEQKERIYIVVGDLYKYTILHISNIFIMNLEQFFNLFSIVNPFLNIFLIFKQLFCNLFMPYKDNLKNQ